MRHVSTTANQLELIMNEIETYFELELSHAIGLAVSETISHVIIDTMHTTLTHAYRTNGGVGQQDKEFLCLL